MEQIDWTPIYIASQVVTVAFYALLAWSYFLKTQKSILVVGFFSLVLNAVAFVMLGAWTGVMMCVVALVRNIVRYFADADATKGKKNFGTSIWFLLIIFAAVIATTIPTYAGMSSILAMAATSIYSYSVWQKKPIIYKLCGIPVGVLWVVHNVLVASVFGWILEGGLLVFVGAGILVDWKRHKLNAEH